MRDEGGGGHCLSKAHNADLCSWNFRSHCLQFVCFVREVQYSWGYNTKWATQGLGPSVSRLKV